MGLLTSFPTFVPELKNDKIPNFLCPVSSVCVGGGGRVKGGGLLTSFAIFVPDFENEKNLSNFLCQVVRGLTYFLTFVSEFKNDKIQNSLHPVEGGLHLVMRGDNLQWRLVSN